LILALFALLCADCATTWMLLSRYRGRVREAGPLQRLVSGYYGQLSFAMFRVALLAVICTYGGTWGMAAWGAVTLFAVINNLRVWRKLDGN